MTFFPNLFPRFFVLVAPAFQTPLFFLAFLYSRRDDAKEQQRVRVFCVVERDEFERLVEQVSSYPERPCSIVGFATPEQCEADLDNLRERVGSTKASVLVLSNEAQAHPRIVDEVRRLHRAGVRVRPLARFYEQWLGKLPLGELSPMELMVDHSDIHRLVYGRVKRAIDVLGGLALGLVLALLIPFILVGNHFGNRGPLLFRQRRVGRDDTPFDLYKLRSMIVAESDPSRPTGAGEWTRENDERITRFGRLLRRLHIDELPQFVNLLRGQLSLVGPRPEQPHYVAELESVLPLYELRHGVRPGITGWAQVKWPYGSSMEDASQKLQYDLYYVVHQGFGMDIRTLARTVRSVILRGGR